MPTTFRDRVVSCVLSTPAMSHHVTGRFEDVQTCVVQSSIAEVVMLLEFLDNMVEPDCEQLLRLLVEARERRSLLIRHLRICPRCRASESCVVSQQIAGVLS
jgi:hypothetical protein